MPYMTVYNLALFCYCLLTLGFVSFLAGIYVEEILTKWKGDYDKLEHNHTYIQW